MQEYMLISMLRKIKIKTIVLVKIKQKIRHADFHEEEENQYDIEDFGSVRSCGSTEAIEHAIKGK